MPTTRSMDAAEALLRERLSLEAELAALERGRRKRRRRSSTVSSSSSSASTSSSTSSATRRRTRRRKEQKAKRKETRRLEKEAKRRRAELARGGGTRGPRHDSSSDSEGAGGGPADNGRAGAAFAWMQLDNDARERSVPEDARARRQIVVHPIPRGVASQDLAALFSRSGEVVRTKLYDTHAVLTYLSRVSVGSAVRRFHDTKLRGQTLTVVPIRR
eukprot:TRINITY_DN18645_c0_g1_i1.p2 TRINITY_DN18645_c0_g1~~TRINITY_DN18645_c0_g1_i1.p2  ORF type:complete len:216 (+),score=45.74 TRINITY_DN18645_c0_g1_i1:72-719(+)